VRRGGTPGGERPRTHAERLASEDGYFAPGSVIRRVGNSPLVALLGGGPAVLLQVAHPLVAAGVAEHSDFRAGLWRRLLGTMRALYMIVYGTRDEAEAAGAAVRAVHERVRGRTAARLGVFPPGTPYSASDPQLMLWVHGTLVHVSLALHCRLVGRLSANEQERYYREMSLVARIFGTPPDVIPRRLADFRAYFADRLAAPEIAVTPPAREVAAVILEAPLPAPLRLLAPAHRLSSAGLLPPRLRSEYGLEWSPLRELALPVAGSAVRVAATPLLALAAHRAPPSLPPRVMAA
jgi:uncharacterized protein (DUF2236 family)